MSEAHSATSAALSAEGWRAAANVRQRCLLFWAALLAVATGAICSISPALGPILLLCLLIPLVFWHFPRAAALIALAGACLFEVIPINAPDDITGRVPLFWNVNTIFQRYGHVNLKAVPLNGLELLLAVAAVCSLIRAALSRKMELRSGRLFWPILGYSFFVIFAYVLGIATGGDPKIALMEVRSQFYFLIAYLLAVNLFEDVRGVDQAIWITILSIGLKGILYCIRRYVTLHGMSISDQGVGSHEEALFFDLYVVLLLILISCKARPRLTRVMLVLLPFVILGNLACNRRSATAAMLIALPFLLMMSYRTLPERRRLIARGAAIVAVALPIYYVLFQHSESIIGQPARAIHSQIAADERDAASNAYRDAENANLMATIRLAPIQGYGYGKPMLHLVPMADISRIYEYWDIMPHNSILWIWMRVGSVGFLLFWLMISAVIVRGCQTLCAHDCGELSRVVAMFAPLAVIVLVVFGLLDMLMFDMRSVLLSGLFVGLLEITPGIERRQSTSLAKVNGWRE